MALAYIDDTGIHLPDYPTVLDHVKGIMHDIYGDDLYIEADSQDGQLCAAFASMMHDTYALCGDVYNAFSPSTAQGVGLSRETSGPPPGKSPKSPRRRGAGRP